MGLNLLRSFIENGGDVANQQVVNIAEQTGVADTNLYRVFKALSNPSVNIYSEDSATGYRLEGDSTIILSLLAYNATSLIDPTLTSMVEKATAIFNSSVENTKYSFKFHVKWLDKPLYDYSYTYRNYNGNNVKITSYIPEDRQSVNKGDLPLVTNDSQLPNSYYMEFFDLSPLAAADGGTHLNIQNPLKSCYFAIYTDGENARTMVHECLHPVLDHTFANGKNPLANDYESFFYEINELIEKKKLENQTTYQYIREIEDFISNNDNLKQKAKKIRDNIMTTAAIASSVESRYKNLAFYLYSYLKYPEIYDGFNSGTQIEISQIELIIQQLKQ